MSISTLIIGESGTGKTCSLRNLNPETTLLIQPTRKPLPFRSTGWSEKVSKEDNGNIFVCSNAGKICNCMLRTQKEIIVLDDFQYILINMYMAMRSIKGYDKFNEIGGAGFDIARVASELAPNKRVYILGHTQTDEYGHTKIKTIGKMLDSMITLEGLFTTVLETTVNDGQYYFVTQNNGSNTVKSPLGMFNSRLIDNDLNAVDKVICEYYGINPINSHKTLTNRNLINNNNEDIDQ